MNDRGGVTRWVCDSHDRSAENFAYDPADDVVQFTDANGSIFTSTWDPMGRKTGTTITPAAGIGGTSAQSFQYDGLGRMTFARDSVASANADATLVYDSLRRTVEEVQTYDGRTRYLTGTASGSLPATVFTFPSGHKKGVTTECHSVSM